MNDYIIFNEACIYNNEATILFIQSRRMITSISIINSNTDKIYNISYTICIAESLPCLDYGIIIHDKDKIDNFNIIINDIKISNIKIYYPFEEIAKHISSNMNIVSTLVKNYNHRLDEWIQYNIKLGFDKIIIFNNEESKSHHLNEGNDCYEKMNIVTDKYKDSVYVINFPYSTFYGFHWNNIQRLSLHISLTALNNKCNFCAYIDADEFIYINNANNIKMFLNNFNDTIQIDGSVITNKNNNDIICNNILSLCNYVGESGHKKVLVYMKKIPCIQGSNDIIKFLPSPHKTPFHVTMNKDNIMYYHCWVNERYQYNVSQPYISLI
jgi:hypothetical protein